MGRPTKFCRDEAVAVAMDAFWAKGYSAVSVSELAAAMSITRSSFYNSFKTREALFEEVIARYSKNAPDLFLADLPEGAPIIPAIRQALRNLCRMRAADPMSRGCLIINCMALADQDNDAPPQIKAMMETKLARYERLVTRAQKTGELSADTAPKQIAHAIITHMMGINIMCKMHQSEETLWNSTDLFLTALGFEA